MKNRNSPNLVAGSGSERRRIARFSVSKEQFKLARTGKVFGVADLSPQGMALRILDEADLLLLPLGGALEGALNLGGEKVAIKGRVRRVVRESIGCEFEDLGAEARRALERFLDPVRLGSELRAMPTADAGSAWFHGPSGADLRVKRAGGPAGRLTEVSLTAMGAFVRWQEAEGLSTGRIEESGAPGESAGLLRLEALDWKIDAAPDPAKLKIAKTILLSSNLPKELKTELDRTWIATLP